MQISEETSVLIPAEKVSGTNVYNMSGEDLGEIHDVMIDKSSGRVAYAVMSFGGVLGMGRKYHPLPWSALTYNTDKNGYIVNLSKDQLKGAPTFDEGVDPNWDRAYETRLHDYYKLPPYWM